MNRLKDILIKIVIAMIIIVGVQASYITLFWSGDAEQTTPNPPKTRKHYISLEVKPGVSDTVYVDGKAVISTLGSDLVGSQFTTGAWIEHEKCEEGL